MSFWFIWLFLVISMLMFVSLFWLVGVGVIGVVVICFWIGRVRLMVNMDFFLGLFFMEIMLFIRISNLCMIDKFRFVLVCFCFIVFCFCLNWLKICGRCFVLMFCLVLFIFICRLALFFCWLSMCIDKVIVLDLVNLLVLFNRLFRICCRCMEFLIKEVFFGKFCLYSICIGLFLMCSC